MQEKGAGEVRDKAEKKHKVGPDQGGLGMVGSMFGLPEAMKANGRFLSKGFNFID